MEVADNKNDTNVNKTDSKSNDININKTDSKLGISTDVNKTDNKLSMNKTDSKLGVNKPSTDINNNWNQQNTQTLRAWKTSLSKASFIYDYVLEDAKTKLNRILVCSLIITMLSTIISGISTIALTVGNDQPAYKTAALVINAVLIGLGALATCLTGIIKIYKLDDIVSTISAYLVKLDQLYCEIANELVLPESSRENAVTFIKKESENYLNLMKQSPTVDSSKEQEAILKYTAFLEDDEKNFTLTQKYNNDQIIDII